MGVGRESQRRPKIPGDFGLPNDLQGPADAVSERRNVRRLGEVGMIDLRPLSRVSGPQAKPAARLRCEQPHWDHASPAGRLGFVRLHPRVHMQVKRAVRHR